MYQNIYDSLNLNVALHNELQDFKSYKLLEYQPISPDIDDYIPAHEVFEKNINIYFV